MTPPKSSQHLCGTPRQPPTESRNIVGTKFVHGDRALRQGIRHTQASSSARMGRPCRKQSTTPHAGRAVSRQNTSVRHQRKTSKRSWHTEAFKVQLVREALVRPVGNRIKPVCSRYPGIEPCQVSASCRHRRPLLTVTLTRVSGLPPSPSVLWIDAWSVPRPLAAAQVDQALRIIHNFQ